MGCRARAYLKNIQISRYRMSRSSASFRVQKVRLFLAIRYAGVLLDSITYQ